MMSMIRKVRILKTNRRLIFRSSIKNNTRVSIDLGCNTSVHKLGVNVILVLQVYLLLDLAIQLVDKTAQAALV